MAKHLSKEERRQQILEAAIRAFGKRGYHDTQVTHIITEAKVARGTFYLYFKSKREIFDDIVTEISQRVQKVIRPIPTDNIPQIPNEILGNIERATTILLNNPHYIKIFFSDAVGLDAEFDNRLKDFYDEVLEKIRGGLKNGQAMGVVREGDIQILALCLMGSLKEIFYQYVLGTHRPETKKIVQEVYHIVLHAAVKPDLVAQFMDQDTKPATAGM